MLLCHFASYHLLLQGTKESLLLERSQFAFPFICTFWLKFLLLSMIKISKDVIFALMFPFSFLSHHHGLLEYGTTRLHMLPENIGNFFEL